MSAPLIFRIFLRGMRRNGGWEGEGGSFDCGNVSALLIFVSFFLRVKLYLTLSVGGCNYYAFFK